MNPYPALFSALTVGGMKVKNRIFLSPMGTHLAAKDFGVTEALLAYYEARAKGGAGFLTTECVLVSPHTRYGTFHNLALFEDGQVESLRLLPRRVHPYGAKIGVQLLHPSSAAAPAYNDGWTPIAPSPLESRSVGSMPREAAGEELARIVEEFGRAAGRAREAGFDAVELHCCHAHGLLGRFLSPLTNKRTDQYGGSVDGRLRLTLEVIAAVRAQAGADFPLIVRMSCTDGEPGGQSLMEARYIARRLEAAGVSMLHMSDGALSRPWTTTAPSGAPRAYNAERAAELKRCVNIPVGFVGRVREPWAAELALELGCGDAVYMGRALLCDPELPNKAMGGGADTIRPCIGCNQCLTAVNSDQTIRCAMNPEAGRETEAAAPISGRRRLLVAGGGPAGLTAAACAAERGYEVTLREESDRLGGQMYLAAFPPCKQELAGGTRYLIERCRRAGVHIQCRAAAEAGQIAAEGWDAVVVATGGRPASPAFLRGARSLVSAWDVLAGLVCPGRNAVIVGGGLVGCETADFLLPPIQDLAPVSRRITLLEQGSAVGAEEKSAFRPLMVQRLLQKGCEVHTGARVVSAEGDAVQYERDGVLHRITGVETVISAVGVRPERGLAAGLEALGVPAVVIGDAAGAGSILAATREGWEAAQRLP